jgi:L-phenylalanine/L-methionine N-acetyltransferase
MLMNKPALTIRRARVTDAAAFERVMGHPDVQPNLLQLPYPSLARWEQQLKDLDDPHSTSMLLVADVEGQVVGNAGLQAAGRSLRRRHAMSLGICVLPEFQGQGVGRALMQALCTWADDWGQVLRIELTVFADNSRAISLYRRFGFAQEGLYRGYALRHGAYEDCISMARLHPAQPIIGA